MSRNSVRDVERSGASADRSRGSRLAVVFVDDGTWASFFQLGARLRRSGVRTVRVTSESQLRLRAVSRLVFDRCVVLPPAREEEVLRAVLRSENVADVQFCETHRDLLRACLPELRGEVGRAVGRRVDLMDKITAADMMDGAGVATPPRAVLSDPGVREFVDRLGFPLVVKGRTGYGGMDVAIARDADALSGLMSAHDELPEGAYVEQFVEGEKVNYGAVVAPEGVVQEVCYLTREWIYPAGPATRVVTIDDAALRELGRRAVSASGCTGLMNINFLRDARGQSWAVDFNARAFGGLASFMTAGVDFAEGYLRTIGASSRMGATAPRPDVAVTVFPTSLNDAIRQGRIAETARGFLAVASSYRRWLGWRYVLAEAYTTAGALRVARSRRA